MPQPSFVNLCKAYENLLLECPDGRHCACVRASCGQRRAACGLSPRDKKTFAGIADW